MRVTGFKISFLTAEGFDGELSVELDAADRPSLVIKVVSEKLIKEAGCKPKPQPRSGGNGGWQKKPVELVPGQTCPDCGAGMIEKNGTSQKTGKPYFGYACAKRCGGWVNPAIANAPLPTQQLTQVAQPARATVTAPAAQYQRKTLPPPDTNVNATNQPNKSLGLVGNTTGPGRALSSTANQTGTQKQWASR